MALQQAKSADGFVNTIGVNTHLHYTDTVYNKFDSIIKPRLLELGIRHVRDGAATYAAANKDTFFYQRVRELASEGIKFNFTTNSLDTAWSDPTNYGLLDDIYAWSNGAVSSFEATNEPDLQGVKGWVTSTISGQKQLFNTVNSNPVLKDIPVIGPSVVGSSGRTLVGNITDWTDYGNIHNYFDGRHPETTGWGSNGYGSIQWNLEEAKKVSGSDPIIATETGWHNVINSTGDSGIPKDVEAKYIPRLFLTHFNSGIRRTYLYELIDSHNNPGDRESNFGLLNNDGTPQAGFKALKNLINLFEDPGASFTSKPLDFSLGGTTSDVKHTLLQKRDGSFYLALWLGKSGWNPDSRSRIAVPGQAVTVSLPSSFKQGSIHHFQTDGSVKESSLTITNGKLNLTVQDTVKVIELPPQQAATLTTTTPTTTSGASVLQSQGDGLLGTYYHEIDFRSPAFSRRDSSVNFSWGADSPDPLIAPNTFSVRWNGYVLPEYSEEFTFRTTTDDGTRLWVNDQLIIDNWHDQAATASTGKITLEANKPYAIRMDYYESQGLSEARLAWSSASQNLELVPQSQLYTSLDKIVVDSASI